MSVGTQLALWLARDEALEQVRAGATLVAANDRLARTLRQAYGERRQRAGETVWASPRIHSWGVWIDRLWRELAYRTAEPLPTRLTADQERLLWERAIARDPERHRLLAIESTAETARRAAALAVEWRIGSSALDDSESEDVRSFLRWRRQVASWIEEGGWVDGARTADLLIEHSREVDGSALLLAGFDNLTPQQNELLGALRAAGWTVREVSDVRYARARRRRVELDGRREEIRAAARWAKSLVDGGEKGKIGVVVPNLAERRPEVERIFLEAFDAPALLLNGSGNPGFILSAGFPLDRLPLVRTALLALEMHPAETDLATFGAWLCSEAVAGGAEERNARGLLDRNLRDKGAPVIPPVKLGGLLNETPELQAALRLWGHRYRRIPRRQKPARWAATFSRLVEALGWPGEALETAEGRQALIAWSDLLRALAALSATSEDWDYPTARRALVQMARETRIQPQAADAQVEVMNLPDSGDAEFDHLWVTGLDDETWPGELRPNPFLPIALQRERGLPHASAARELELARIKTERLLASAPDVVASHAKSAEDRRLEPSPLIKGLPLAGPDSIVDLSRSGLIETIRASSRVERIEDFAPPLPPGAASPGGAKIFEMQAHCPFRAFASLRLGAQSLRETEAGLSPGERGNLAHYALESIWSTLDGSDDLRRRGEGEMRETIEQAVAFALGRLEEKRRAPLPTRFQAIERERLQALLRSWLEMEKTHRREPFRVAAVEEKHTVEILGLAAAVRVDRIDELEDGRRVILDYKTGAANEKEWDRERSMQPQLPLYAVHHAESLGGVLFARLKTLQTGFKGAVAPGVNIEGAEMDRAGEFDERVAYWRANLEALAADFLAGRAEVDPRDGKCGYCDLAGLCRKDDAHDAD